MIIEELLISSLRSSSCIPCIFRTENGVLLLINLATAVFMDSFITLFLLSFIWNGNLILDNCLKLMKDVIQRPSWYVVVCTNLLDSKSLGSIICKNKFLLFIRDWLPFRILFCHYCDYTLIRFLFQLAEERSI